MNISSNLLSAVLPGGGGGGGAGGGGAKCSPICLCLSRLSITLKITPSPCWKKKLSESCETFQASYASPAPPPSSSSPPKNAPNGSKMRANLHTMGLIRTKPLILNLTPGMHDNNDRSGKSGARADLQRAVCDVVDVHGEDVVFAAHVHPVLVLVHMQDPVVHGLV